MPTRLPEQPPLPQPKRPQRSDWLVLAGMLLVAFVPYALGGTSVEALVMLLQLLPLPWRRVAPVPAFLAVALATLAQVPWTDNVQPANFSLLLCIYAVIVWEPRRRLHAIPLLVGAIGSGVAAVDWIVWSAEAQTLAGSDRVLGIVVLAFGCLVMVALAAAWGDSSRRRRELVHTLHERAVGAERERDQQARLAAQTERTRIAREMHDVVAHALAVIVVQSDGAAYAVRHSRSPDVAADALDTIGGTAREALSETRRLVGVLRDESSDAELAPTAGLADLPALVERVREAGLPVELEMDDRLVDELQRGPGSALYRVAQESLTNVIKHAGPEATAEVRLTREPREVQLVVDDTGLGSRAAQQDGGHGLVGMRERVHAYDGQLSAAPRVGGGFRVLATIPLPEETEKA